MRVNVSLDSSGCMGGGELSLGMEAVLLVLFRNSVWRPGKVLPAHPTLFI